MQVACYIRMARYIRVVCVECLWEVACYIRVVCVECLREEDVVDVVGVRDNLVPVLISQMDW
jgi:hypothetical protein